MIRHLRDIQARRRGEELAEKGFTLIELLIVIVVLGILAATVVFALTGVTGQSAQAACNSDAKTIETAVQAYIDSPNNPTNGAPAAGPVTALVSGPYGASSTPLRPTRRTTSRWTPAATVIVTPTNGGAAGTYDSTTTTLRTRCSSVT